MVYDFCSSFFSFPVSSNNVLISNISVMTEVSWYYCLADSYFALHKYFDFCEILQNVKWNIPWKLA